MTGACYGLAGQFWLLESPLNEVFDYVQWAVSQTQGTKNKRFGDFEEQKKYQGQTRMDEILNHWEFTKELCWRW